MYLLKIFTNLFKSQTYRKFAILLILLMMYGACVFAQNLSNPVQTVESSSFSYKKLIVFLLSFVAVLEFIVILVLCYVIVRLSKSSFVSTRLTDTPYMQILHSPNSKQHSKKNLFEILNNTVPIERENELLMDHDYDGIKELDNKMPPWFLWLFNVTIVIALIYFSYYHIFSLGKLPAQELEADIAAEKIRLEEYRKTAANHVDETNVTLIKDPSVLKEGETIFKANCVVCHGQNGEGGIGPNLTDDYWLHGGTIGDLFKTIKYGIPDKGMKSWQQDLSPGQMQQVASYIKSLHGTNPPNAKAPQGDIFKDSEQSEDNNSSSGRQIQEDNNSDKSKSEQKSTI